MLPLRACALAFCASCLAFAFTPASTLIAPDGAAALHNSIPGYINCVTSQTNLLLDVDAADKITVSLKSKILGYVTSRYIKKLYPVKAVNSYVIPVRGGGVSRQVC
jgi:hypothetical protein